MIPSGLPQCICLVNKLIINQHCYNYLFNNETFQVLLDVVQTETLGNKVAIALNQKSQGHFDKAMLNISEANRDQVLSIREIQAIIDRVKGNHKTEVVFEK